jgi:hypothetical protein
VPVDEGGHAIWNALSWMDTRGGCYSRAAVDGWPKIEGYAVSKLLKWVRLTGAAPNHSGVDGFGQCPLPTSSRAAFTNSGRRGLRLDRGHETAISENGPVWRGRTMTKRRTADQDVGACGICGEDASSRFWILRAGRQPCLAGSETAPGRRMRLAHQRMALWLILNQVWKSKMEIRVERRKPWPIRVRPNTGSHAFLVWRRQPFGERA